MIEWINTLALGIGWVVIVWCCASGVVNLYRWAMDADGTREFKRERAEAKKRGEIVPPSEADWLSSVYYDDMKNWAKAGSKKTLNE